ncbi:MAG: HAD-IB family phosphatase [Planctomycetota bacterium]
MTAPTTPFERIWFDCDSTLARIEGIDELGASADDETRQRVAEATNRAMGGEVPLEEVFAERLRLLGPTRSECEALGQRYIDAVVDDAGAVFDALRSFGKSIGVISGGLRPPVLALARHLGVADEDVFAVDLNFREDGSYDDFDRESPLARSGGKPDLLRRRPATEAPTALVGDGVTDLETRTVVDRFVGFTGVVRREAIVAGTPFLAEGPGLATALPFLLTEAELEVLSKDPRSATLFGALD